MSDRTKLMLVWPVAGFFAAMAFGVGLISMAMLDSDQAATSSAAVASGAGQRIEVELGELFIKPEKLEAEAGAVTFEVTNTGQTEHNFAIEGIAETEMIPPGESATLDVPNLAAGTYTYICEVTGHADGGMTGTLEVSGGNGEQASGAEAPAAHGMSAKEMALHDAKVTGSFPADTKGTGGRDLKPKSSTGSRSSS